MVFVVAASVVLVVLVSVLVKLARRLAAPPPISMTVQRIDELSIDTANLLRLLEEDFRSSDSQDGAATRMAFKSGVQRWKQMHERLRHLKDDFRLVCTALKFIIVESKQDRPDLAWVLLRNQMTFAYGMAVARFRLACFVCGVLASVALDKVRKVPWWRE